MPDASNHPHGRAKANPSSKAGARHSISDLACYGNHISLSNTKNQPHETILQTLNRWLNYEDGNYYLGLENFQGTEPEWESVPVIFAQDHPDMGTVDTDIKAAVDAVQGTILPPGTIRNVQVVTPGQPRLVADTKFTDPNLQTLYNEGKLSLSTGFYAKGSDGKIVGKVVPNHVLIFVQDDNNQPRDRGAMFLNKEEQDMPDSATEHQNKGAVFSKKNLSLIEQAIAALTAMVTGLKSGDEENAAANKAPPESDEQNAQERTNMDTDKLTALENKTKELTTALDAKTKEITNKDAEISRLNKELGDLKDKVALDAENATWAALKNTLPKAWTETADAEAKTRTEWKDNKDAFLLKVANLKRVPDTTEAGKEFENNTTDAIAIQRKLLAASGRMR